MPLIGFDPTFLLLIPGMLLAMWAQFRLSSAYARYSRMGTHMGLTGGDTARAILDRNGLQDVQLREVAGHLTDHYDPTKRAVFLSSENFRGNSIAAMAVAAHEVGHALQHKTVNALFGLRMALVPVTNFASRASFFIIMAGLFLQGILGPLSRYFLWGGVALFAIVALFQLVTLPVEYDASRRARSELLRLGLIHSEEAPPVSSMLNAAALTYVAAMLTSLLELLRWVLIARSRDRD